MEDIAQPSSEPYSIGDQVQIYISSEDADVQYHNLVCEVVEVFTDDLSIETGRTTDAYSYTLRDIGTTEELPVAFRHHDLIPAENDQ